MQFVVTGLDGTDSDALNRRMAAREAHIEGFERGKAEGKFLFAAAMLDANEKMIGSMVFCDFPTRADLDAWLKTEPYILGKVWETVEVQSCNVLPSCIPAKSR